MTHRKREAITTTLRCCVGGPRPFDRLATLAAALAFVVCAGRVLDAQVAHVATVGLTPGWATFGQALPAGAAGKSAV